VTCGRVARPGCCKLDAIFTLRQQQTHCPCLLTVFSANRTLPHPPALPFPSLPRCLCKECAAMLKESKVDKCPMCREPIEAFIMRVF
jgi:hypothetical protein